MCDDKRRSDFHRYLHRDIGCRMFWIHEEKISSCSLKLHTLQTESCILPSCYVYYILPGKIEMAVVIEIILGSESFAKWLVSLALALALAPELELVLALEIELALVLDIERYRITASVSHLTCPLPPHHQSELVLVLALEIELVLALEIEYYHITTSVNHLTCPLPPHQSVIWLSHCHHISQSFDLPSTTTLPHWSVIWLAPTTTSVNHLTCPLPPIRQSFDLPTATTSLCPHHPLL